MINIMPLSEEDKHTDGMGCLCNPKQLELSILHTAFTNTKWLDFSEGKHEPTNTD